MASPRFDGGSAVASRPSITTCPREVSSSPAIIRRSVDFPQPEGPTKITNSPSAIDRSTPLMTCTSPNHFSTDFSSIAPITHLQPARGLAQASQTAAVHVNVAPPAGVPSSGLKYSAKPFSTISRAVSARTRRPPRPAPARPSGPPCSS
jgi:hypothetical protein